MTNYVSLVSFTFQSLLPSDEIQTQKRVQTQSLALIYNPELKI